MPTVHRLGTIRICVYVDDHNPPHFHALVAGQAVQIKIVDLTILAGSIPPAGLRRVLDWAADHQDFLAAEWVKRN